MDKETFRWITEVLSDAEACARLTKWEENFCDDMRSKMLLYNQGALLSDAQIATLQRIEVKVYAT